MQTKRVPYTFNRGGYFYFTRRVPSDLKQHYLCPRIVQGLNTKCFSTAKKRASVAASKLDEPYGKQAKWALHKLVKGQTIRAIPNGEKSYDRIVAKCFLEDGTDIAAELVKMGLALDLPNYPDADYRHLETPASRKKLSWKPKKKETET